MTITTLDQHKLDFRDDVLRSGLNVHNFLDKPIRDAITELGVPCETCHTRPTGKDGVHSYAFAPGNSAPLHFKASAKCQANATT